MNAQSFLRDFRCKVKCAILVFWVCFLGASLYAEAGVGRSQTYCADPYDPNCRSSALAFQFYRPRLLSPNNAWASTRTTLGQDLSRANLVTDASERLRKKLGATGAIQLLGSDFALFASPGKTQLNYFSDGETTDFDMIIGEANAVTAQTWNLPAGLINQLERVQRNDFIPVSSVPAGLNLTGATHVSRTVSGNRIAVGYRQYQLKPNEVQYLGYAVDRKVGLDYQTASPDVGSSFAVVPLGLGASFSNKVIVDSPDDENRGEVTHTLTFNGFGTLNTPNGSFQALRYTVTTTDEIFDLSDPNDPVLIDTETTTQVGWVTKEGTWIVADYKDYNPTTKAAKLSGVLYSTIVPTSSLSPTFTNSCGCNR
jgi:hypothetical protein